QRVKAVLAAPVIASTYDASVAEPEQVSLGLGDIVTKNFILGRSAAVGVVNDRVQEIQLDTDTFVVARTFKLSDRGRWLDSFPRMTVPAAAAICWADTPCRRERERRPSEGNCRLRSRCPCYRTRGTSARSRSFRK